MTGAMTSENMSPVLLRVMVRVSQAKGVCKHLGTSMRRISGGAVWSNRPSTDLARAPAEKSAGATLRTGLSLKKRLIILKSFDAKIFILICTDLLRIKGSQKASTDPLVSFIHFS